MSELTSLAQQIRAIRRKVDGRIAEARLIASTGKSLKEEISLAEKDVELYEKVAITLASIGETRQAAAQTTIEELVSRGLQTIFSDSDITFHVMQTQRGKTPEVKFMIESNMDNKKVKTSIMDARGGGYAAVVGFLLRLVNLMLSNNEPIIIGDEMFTHVSAEFRRPLAEFLSELVDKTKAQFIIVTHDPVLAEFADRKYKVTQSNGVSSVREI